MNSVASAPVSTSRFEQQAIGTVADSKLDLVWSPTLTEKCVTHAEAERVCAEYSPDGQVWRLPTIEELFLLADRSRHSPAIDTDAFPDTQVDWYWSSTIHAANSDLAWIVRFDYGYAHRDHRGYYNAFVRAARSAAPGQ